MALNLKLFLARTSDHTSLKGEKDALYSAQGGQEIQDDLLKEPTGYVSFWTLFHHPVDNN